MFFESRKISSGSTKIAFLTFHFFFGSFFIILKSNMRYPHLFLQEFYKNQASKRKRGGDKGKILESLHLCAEDEIGEKKKRHSFCVNIPISHSEKSQDGGEP